MLSAKAKVCIHILSRMHALSINKMHSFRHVVDYLSITVSIRIAFHIIDYRPLPGV